MRTPLLAAVLSFSLAGCVVGDVTTGAGDDDGPGSDPGPGSNPIPRLAITVDKPTMATELMTTNMVTVTAQASGGFSGPVTLTAAVVDAGGTAMPGWTISLNNATVDVPLDGTATAVATVKI